VTKILNARAWFLFCAVACFSMLAWAYYKQYVDFVDPCPLCILQRIAFLWIGVVGLVAAIHGPGVAGRWFYGLLLAVGGGVGMALAGRHVWLQNLPADQVPDCGMGLNYMLDTMPVLDVLKEVLYGAGECAEVMWTFLGISIPGWALIWFTIFTLGTLGVLVFSQRNKVRQ
jgi:disulfide bond formation protein DsbB